MKDKSVIEEKTKKLAEMTASFCDEKLDDDYKQLCQKLIIKMKRKRIVPFLCNYFGTSRSTTSQKARMILDTFKMTYFDEEFSTTRNKERNPLSKFAMVNGFIVPIDAFVDEIDEQTEEGRKNM